MEPQRLSPDAPAHPPRFVALDGLRAVGALGVLTTHVAFQSGDSLQGQFAGFLARLDAGVALFFVVSGFLLFRPHVVAHLDGHTRPRTRRYLWYRAVRILPVLWVAVALAWLLIGDSTARLYLAHAFLVQIYISDHLVHGLTQMWSLATEVAFYLALPAIAALLCRGTADGRWIRRAAGVLAVPLILGPLWMYSVTAMGYSLPRLWLPGFLGWFSAGMLLALWNAAAERRLITTPTLFELTKHPGSLWALAFAFYALATTPLAGPLDLSEPTAGAAALKNVLYCAIAVLVVLPTIPRNVPATPALALLSGRVGRLLGSISYGLFAYHVLVLFLVDETLGLSPFDGRFVERFLPTLGISVVLAAVSYRFMERPLMRWARRWRRRGAPAPASTEDHDERSRTSSESPAQPR